MEVHVLRLGHRINRDKRISTHVALTARALGAKAIYFDTYDESVFKSVRDVVERWGGDFSIEKVEWRSFLKNFSGLKVHLTMYGMPLIKKIDEIKKAEQILVVVGAEKVPHEVYEICDMNISIGNQPHSEVAALAIFLDRVLNKTFNLDFKNAKVKVIPSEKGKKVVEVD